MKNVQNVSNTLFYCINLRSFNQKKKYRFASKEMFLSYILQKLKKCKFHYLCEIGVYFVEDVINGPSQNLKGLIERLGYTPEQK